MDSMYLSSSAGAAAQKVPGTNVEELNCLDLGQEKKVQFYPKQKYSHKPLLFVVVVCLFVCF